MSSSGVIMFIKQSTLPASWSLLVVPAIKLIALTLISLLTC